jgi:sterol desaturase/sphingolipid hydroxylase (fatty acid hydroxylase superfamily)
MGAAALFAALSLLAKGFDAFGHARRAYREVGLNLFLWGLNAVLLRVLLFGLALSLTYPDHYFESFLFATLLSFLALEFADYWLHRLRHSVALWRFHRLHHSDPEMTWTTIHRKHPVDYMLTVFGEYFFLLAAGVPAAGIVAASLFRSLYIAFVHADLNWSFGTLRYVLITPWAHRYHHALDERLAGANFGGVLSIWDRMFGTYVEPDHRAETGVRDVPSPTKFLREMRWPTFAQLGPTKPPRS